MTDTAPGAINQDAQLKTIRPTDNKARPEDGIQPPQDAKPLEISEDGLPVEVKFGGDA